MSHALDVAAAVSLATFTVLSLIDGGYIHLLRERLHEKGSSRLEHWLHTARGLVAVGLLCSWFRSHDGSLFWIGVALLAVDQVLELSDMAIERRSRSYSQGLRSDEYVVHGLLITSRTAAVLLTYLAHRAGDAALTRELASLFVPGAIAMTALHVLIVRFPRLIPHWPRQLAGSGGMGGMSS